MYIDTTNINELIVKPYVFAHTGVQLEPMFRKHSNIRRFLVVCFIVKKHVLFAHKGVQLEPIFRKHSKIQSCLVVDFIVIKQTKYVCV